MKTVELEDDAARALEVLRERASKNNVRLDHLLIEIAQSLPETSRIVPLNTDWQTELDELAADSDDVPPLPREFGRNDIYCDRD